MSQHRRHPGASQVRKLRRRLMNLDRLPSTEPGPYQQTAECEAGRLLRKLIASLPSPLSGLMIAHYYEGQSIREISWNLGVGPGQASRLHRRAIHMLQRCFQSRGIGLEAFPSR